MTFTRCRATVRPPGPATGFVAVLRVYLGPRTRSCPGCSPTGRSWAAVRSLRARPAELAVTERQIAGTRGPAGNHDAAIGGHLLAGGDDLAVASHLGLPGLVRAANSRTISSRVAPGEHRRPCREAASPATRHRS